MMWHRYVLVLIFCSVSCQRYQPIEFTEVMGQCEDLMCNFTSTCDFRNASCFGRPCTKLECVPKITKPGICPPGIRPGPGVMLDCDGLAEFLPSCYEDNHCPGAQKCCPSRCMFRECQRVPLPTTPTRRPPTTTRRPTTINTLLVLPNSGRRNNIFLGTAVDSPNRLYVKDGACPPSRPDRFPGLCTYLTNRISPCLSDSDCAGDRKCCPGRCKRTECVMAIFSTNGSALGTVERASRNNNAPRYLPAATTILLPLLTTPTVTPLPITSAPTVKTPVSVVKAPKPPPPSSPSIIPAIVIPQAPVPAPAPAEAPAPAPAQAVDVVAKPGSCPPKDLNWSFFCPYLRNTIKSCRNDRNCPEVQKCCPGRCELYECKTPILTELDASIFLGNNLALGLGTNFSSLLTPTTRQPIPAAAKTASCPQINRSTSNTTPSGQSLLADLFVCNLMLVGKPECRRHSECLGQTMCCRTRCADYRCLDPVYS